MAVAVPPADAITAPRGGSFRRWLGKRSTIGVLMCLPLLAVVAG